MAMELFLKRMEQYQQFLLPFSDCDFKSYHVNEGMKGMFCKCWAMITGRSSGIKKEFLQSIVNIYSCPANSAVLERYLSVIVNIKEKKQGFFLFGFLMGFLMGFSNGFYPQILRKPWVWVFLRPTLIYVMCKFL